MQELPPEIWYRITEYLSDADLKQAIGLNRLFFERGMNLRYKTVSVGTKKLRNAMRILERLSDPLIAARVVEFNLNLGDIIQRHQQHPSVSSAENLLSTIQGKISRVWAKRHTNKSPGRSVVSENPLDDFVSALVAVNKKLVNLKAFSLDQWALSPTHDLSKLFESMWKTFGPQLQTLIVRGTQQSLVSIVNSSPRLPSLTEFRVELTNNYHGTDSPGTLIDIVIPFILRFKAQLRVLGVSSFSSQVLTPFFDELSKISFPCLKRINVQCDFNVSFVGEDPHSLRTFLTDASTSLQEVDLRLKPAGIIADPTLELRLANWLLDCFNEPRFFTNLTYLDFYGTALNPVGIDVHVQAIRRNSAQLGHFVARDRYLRIPEVQELLEALSACPKLRYLRLALLQMEIEIIDAMAIKVSCLETLHLNVGHSVMPQPSDPFYTALRTKRYREWRLKDLHLWQGGQEQPKDVMIPFAEAIPSIESFFGSGHLNLNFDHYID